MNIRNLFHRQPQQAENHTPIEPDFMRILVATPIRESDETYEDEVNAPIESDQLHVPAQDGHNNPAVSPWIVRDKDTFSREQIMMAQHWPDFQLEVIEDQSSPFHGSTCWSGKLKPGIYEDMEWEILAMYQGIGGGCGDWSGAITIYFIDPSCEQIAYTLGYTPVCMQMDNEGTKILNNLRPIPLSTLSAAHAIQYAYTFCEIIEKMCGGQLPEDALLTNDYLMIPDPLTSMNIS